MDSVLVPKTWRIASRQEALDRLKSKQKRRVGSLAVIRKIISPLDIYCYLYSKFGPPNGVQMLFRIDDSNNLVHWHYDLRSEEDIVDVQAQSQSLHIFVESSRRLGVEDWKTLAKNLKNEYPLHARGKAEALSRLERWERVINPYRRLRSSVDSLTEELKKLMQKFEKFQHIDLKRSGDIESFKRRAKRYSVLLNAIVQRCLSLQFYIPVMAESFINILMFVLLKTEFKNDDRVREGLYRAHIDQRVKTIHVVCDGFDQAIDMTTDAGRHFKRVMDRRNDVMHGNVVPHLKLGEVYFDGKIPIFKDSERALIEARRFALTGIEPERILKDAEGTIDFFEEVLTCLSSDAALPVGSLLEAAEIGVDKKTGKFGILFSSQFIESHLGFDEKNPVFFD